jgi:glycosyltransferase involved in cell wall biosynthesis
VSTKERARKGRDLPVERVPHTRRLIATELSSLLVVCLVGGLVAGFFLGLYRAKGLRVPVGYDAARYLDQTVLVADEGLVGAAHTTLPPPSKPLTSRVVFPVLDLALSRLFGVSTFKFAAVVPVAAIAAIALGAGALVSFALRRSALTLAVVALVVGTSTPMVRLLVPEAYLDNLFAGALFVAALVPLLSYVQGGRGGLPATLLLGMAGLAHPGFFSFNLLILGLAGMAYLPGSWRAWRRDGVAPLTTPPARLAAVLAGAAAISLVAVYAVLRTGPDVPWFSREVFAEKLRADVHLYLFPVTAPLALLGGAALAAEMGWARLRRRSGGGGPAPAGGDGERPADRRSLESDERRAMESGPGPGSRAGARFLFAIMAGWTLATLAGFIAFELGRPLPMHRLLAFLLPLPILGALAVLAGAGLAGARLGRAAGAVVALAGLIALGSIGYHSLYVDIPRKRGVEPVQLKKVQDAATASSYLDALRVPESRPVVFVVTDLGKDPRSGVPLEAYSLRTMLSAERARHAYLYVGDPENFLAGRPTTEANDTRRFNEVSAAYWPAVQRILPAQPVALVLSSYNPAFAGLAAEHPDWVVAPGVIALRGPRPPAPLPRAPAPSAPFGAVQLLLYGVGALVILGLVGLGWSVAMLPTGLRPIGPSPRSPGMPLRPLGAQRVATPLLRPFEVLALAVAFGIAFLVLGGTLMDTLGLRLGGVGGVVAVPAIGGLGWMAAAWRLSRLRTRGGPFGEPFRRLRQWLRRRRRDLPQRGPGRTSPGHPALGGGALARIAVCHPQVPFVTGGAEAQTAALVEALRREDHEAELVTLPYKWYPPEELVNQMAVWRGVDLSESNGQPIDCVIALKFPAYLIRHDRKVVWLMQQYHPAYELWGHPDFGELSNREEGRAVRDMIWQADRLALGEAKRLFANSQNVADRLHRALGIDAEVLYHRSPLCEALLNVPGAAYGDYVLFPSRFERRKRQAIAVEAMRYATSEVRLVLVGKGPDEERLRASVAESGMGDRVEIRTGVSDEELIRLYREALAVCYIPLDEDYGYVTLEGFAARRAVITATDSGGPLEFVRDEETGLVVEPDPASIGAAFDRLSRDRQLAERMGSAGHDLLLRSVPDWGQVVARLLG